MLSKAFALAVIAVEEIAKNPALFGAQLVEETIKAFKVLGNRSLWNGQPVRAEGLRFSEVKIGEEKLFGGRCPGRFFRQEE